MKRLFAAGVVLVALVSCGGDDASAPASPSPSATHEITGRIMGPADKARDVSDQLDQRYGEDP